MSGHHRADASALLDNRGYTGPLIRGANPATLLETAVRDRITDSLYWKEQCFGLNAATLLDRAVDMTYIGGTYGVGMKPTPFLCLIFKMLQLTPEKEVVLEYLRRGGEEFKYLRALAAFYVRLTFSAVEIYQTLEPLLEDGRKLRRRRKEGYELTYVDQFVDDLLTKDRVCATSLWKLPSRQALEDLGSLEERISPMQEELDRMDEEEDEVMDGEEGDKKAHANGHDSEGGGSGIERSEDESD